MQINIKLFTFIIASLLFEGASFAGGMDSGGGQGFVCFDSKEVAQAVMSNKGNIANEYIENITSLETLDLFEAKMKRGSSLSVPSLMAIGESEGSESYLNRIIERIEKNIPVLGQKIRAAEHNFSNDNLIWADIGLIPVNDSNVVGAYDTPFCTLTTLAIQFKEENSDYLNIDPRLFLHPKMSNQSRAILFLHEYLYLTARRMGKTSSRSSRLAISFLIRDDHRTTLRDVAENLYKLNILSVEEFESTVSGLGLNELW